MKLVKYCDNPEGYLNMDNIDSVVVDAYDNIRAYINRSDQFYYISKSAYNTILTYGKAKV